MTKSPLSSLLQKEMTRKEFLQWLGLLVAALFGIEGVIRLLQSHAATPSISAEAENGSLTSPAALVMDGTASGGKAVQFGAAAPPTPPPTTGTNTYRPLRITDPGQLPHAPQNANYVNWNTLGVATIDQAFAKLGFNDILVLPERSAPYEINSSHGFMRDSGHFYSMTRAKRGLVGLGPGVIVQPSASSYSSGHVSFGGGGNQNRIMECYTTGGYFGNFEMRGRDFGGVQYDATVHGGAGAAWERIYFNGAHRGYANLPDGETGAISANAGANMAAYNSEIDCRDPATGTRVGPSPLMWNNQSNVTVTDVYAHHSVAGMPTFWRCNGATVTRLRSEYMGTGTGHTDGSCLNQEQCSGTFVFKDCTFLTGFANHLSVNSGDHFSIGAGPNRMTDTITNPTFDTGSGGAGKLTVALYSEAGSASNVTVTATNASGGSIPIVG